MENHLSRQPDGTIALGISNPAEINVSQDVFDILSKSLQMANGYLKAGTLHASQVGLRTDFGPSAQTISPRATAAGTCAGNDNRYGYWWGTRQDFNECLTQQLINDLNIDAAIATIGGVIAAVISLPIGLIIGLAAGLEQLGAAILTSYDVQCGHQGVAIYFSYFEPVPWFGCP